MNIELKHFLDKCSERFGEEVIIIKSPGRANIIGEHIDYCGGTVLPFALDLNMFMCITNSLERYSTVESHVTGEKLLLRGNSKNEKIEWANYFERIIDMVLEKNALDFQFNLYFYSEIPIGGGLSSSTALCCGFLMALNELYGLSLSTKELIDLASEAEYGLGLFGGKMDQYAILYGKESSALILDCKSYELSYLEIALESQFYIINSGVKHKLIGSEFNLRRSQAEEALRMIQRVQGKSVCFQQLTMSDLECVENPILRNRIDHIVDEQNRVKEFIKALKRGDERRLGLLIDASHVSLRDKYEVSCEEVDFVCDALQTSGKTLGSRIMGGGFGGHVLVLAKKTNEDQLKEILQKSYKAKFNLDIEVTQVKPSRGAGVYSLKKYIYS